MKGTASWRRASSFVPYFHVFCSAVDKLDKPDQWTMNSLTSAVLSGQASAHVNFSAPEHRGPWFDRAKIDKLCAMCCLVYYCSIAMFANLLVPALHIYCGVLAYAVNFL
jgi:hypothetical protein